jgi:hypothetical protein
MYRTCVSMVFASCVLVCAQPRSAPQLDEWQALDLSLKQRSMKSDIPKEGFVPNEQTAIAIGEAVATALYGGEQVATERPFRARLRGDVWTVKGTLRPTGAFGGTAVIQVSKRDGRVLFAVHQH